MRMHNIAARVAQICDTLDIDAKGGLQRPEYCGARSLLNTAGPDLNDLCPSTFNHIVYTCISLEI